MTLKKLVTLIKQNGNTGDLSMESKLNIEISNIFNIIFVFLVFPFIFIFRETPLASLLTAFPIVIFIICFLLVRYHQYKIGRFIFSLTTPTTIYFVAALLFQDSGTDGMAAKLLILADAMLPFMVFSKKEWKFIIPILIINLFYLITFNYTNHILNVPCVHNVDTPVLRTLSLLTVFIMFVIFFFYYKITLANNFQKIEETNKKLLLKNKELHDLNATKDKLFSVVSHDIRGPLHSMLGISEILYENHSSFNKENLQEFAESFYSSSKNTYALVDNLLSWSQIQMNGIKVCNEIFALDGFIRETTENYINIAQKKGIRIINKIENNFNAKADKSIARCILQNLISNAIKFSYPNSLITVSGTLKINTTKDYISVCVSDSGIGMDSETIERLFQPGKIKSRSGTNNEQGTGIGLSFCKEFAELNGGEISVLSSPGKGSTISFTLPLAIEKLSMEKHF